MTIKGLNLLKFTYRNYFVVERDANETFAKQ